MEENTLSKTEDFNNSEQEDKSQFEDILKFTYQEAGKGIRFLNLILDTIFFVLFLFLFFFMLGIFANIFGVSEMFDYIDENSFIWNIIGIFITFVYYMFFESLLAMTPGKLITRTIAITDDGEKPPFKSILIRSACRLVPFEAFTFLTSSKGFHDNQSNTQVVTLKSYRSMRTLIK